MSEIKQGYKQTKVGVIPDDWEVVKIKEVAKVKDGTHFSPKSTCGEFKYITSKNIKFGYLDLSDISYVSEEEHKVIYKSCPVKKYDLLLTKDGANTGNACINTLDEEFSLLSSVAFLDGLKNKLLNQFLLQQILWNKTQKRLQAEMSGQAITRLTITKIDSFNIILPPLKEQEKIAQILTTWDDAITKQTELLEAKELQKKALMQKLLSGEVRFYEFSDDWEDIRLGKYIKEVSKKNKENIELVLSVTNKHGFIAQKDYFDKEVASKDTSNYKIVKRGNFAYNPSRINVGSLGLLEEYEIGILSPMYVIFECLKGLNKQYLNYWLNTHNFTGNLSKFLSGSVRDSLAFNDMKLMRIKLPSLPEQQKIAEVLSLADDEINLLKNELKELKLQKKALMQKLLTGEVRVNV